MKRPIADGTLQAATVRDELLRHVETAVKALRGGDPSDKQIHRARKELKRARANLRLLRDTVGQSAYIRENTALRDASRPLSGVRDAAILRETADKLISALRRGARRNLLLKVRRALEQARLEARAELRVRHAVRDSAVCLIAAATRMRKWRLDQSDTTSVCRGLQRIYRRGRKAFAIACADPTNENFHEWRKQVKYLGQSMEGWKANSANGTKRLVKRANQLADYLGDDHDLVVFEERLEKLDSPHPIRPAITHDIARRRCDLRDNALKKGRWIFKAKPRSFVRGIAQQG
jgi:CHAD domain-containing protein